MIKVELLQPQDEKNWDEFISSQPDGRFSQTIAFKNVLEDTYGYESKYVLVKDFNKILLILPIFYWRDIFGKRHLVSIPFADYGGVLTDGLNEQEASNFFDYIKNMLVKVKSPFFKINANINLEKNSILLKYFTKVKNDQRAVLNLDSTNILWNRIFDRSVKKCVNTAYREGLKCEINNSEEAIRNHFYPLYLLSMKRFGTPPHPLSYFQNKFKYFGNVMKLFLVKDKNRVVAALMGFATGKTVQITKTVSDPECWKKRPNDLAHWEFIKWAVEHGFTLFDFGPVRYENQAKYKVKWGAKLSENYSYYLLSDIIEKNKFKKKLFNLHFNINVFSKAWSLLPIGVTKHFGPFIRKNLGK